MSVRKRIILVVAAIATTGAGLGVVRVRAGDPGDLFPSVGYEQALESPRRAARPARGGSGSAATQAATVPATAPAVGVVRVPETQAGGVKVAGGGSGGSVVAETRPGVETRPATGPGVVASTMPGKNAAPAAAPFWSPYAEKVLVPLLSVEEKAEFTKSYGDMIKRASESDEARVAASGVLAAAAGPGKVLDANMRRYLVLQALTLAVQGRAPVATREKLAGEFLPMVERDHSLPATQAKATALEALAMSGTGGVSASPRLLDLTAQAYGDLALAQVQAGYPTQAQASLKKGSGWLGRMTEPDAGRATQFLDVRYWLSRAQAAKLLEPKLKQALAAAPNDPAANTQLATLHLSLFADVEQAAACAGKSDRAEFKALAKLVEGIDGGVEAVDPGTAAGLGESLELCRGLLNLLPACGDSFDRFAIATYVKGQADELADKVKSKTGAGAEAWVRLQGIRSDAAAVAAANAPQATGGGTGGGRHSTGAPVRGGAL